MAEKTRQDRDRFPSGPRSRMIRLGWGLVVVATVAITLAMADGAGDTSGMADMSPTPTLPTHTAWGDANCDTVITPTDALAILVYVGGLPPLSQDEPCPDVGSPHRTLALAYGDVFCDGAVDAGDSLGLLLSIAHIKLPPVPFGCFQIGAPVGD
ncbi:MAG: hypothetical protein IIC86_02905 [Chloroflexi bacterium]|nr:hypothetical protein [Chloroflexota bacterium]